LRGLIGLDGTRPPVRRKWSHDVKKDGEGKGKDRKRAMSWGRLRSKSKGGKDLERHAREGSTPERILEEDPKKMVASPTI
jgi:hypothetical protein